MAKPTSITVPIELTLTDDTIESLASAIAAKLGGSVSKGKTGADVPDDDDTEEAEGGPYTEKQLRAMERPEVVAIAAEMELEHTPRAHTGNIIDLILAAQGLAGEEDGGEEAGDGADDESEEEEGEPWDEESLGELDRTELEGVADEWEVAYNAKTKDERIVSDILEAQEAEDGEEGEEAEEGEEEEGGEEAEEGGEEAADGEGDEFWTKEELDKMTIGELKAIARDDPPIDITGMKRAAITAAILAE